MSRSAVLELCVLYGPLVLFLLALRLGGIDFGTRGRVALLFSFCWCVAVLPLVNGLAIFLRWWEFPTTDQTYSVLGVPVSLLLGWAFLWGPCATALHVMLARRLAVWLAAVVTTGCALLVDLMLMPLLGPVLVLGDDWLLGEMVSIAVVLGPGLLLSHLTWLGQMPEVRTGFVAIGFGVIVCFLFPVIAEGWEWADLLRIWREESLLVRAVQAVVLVLAMIPGVSAAWTFAHHGRGTPVPYDPPEKLVTGGVYSYVANPMQISITVTLSLIAVYTRSWWIFGVVCFSVLYAVGVAEWTERRELRERHGDAWVSYRKRVRAWVPRRLEKGR